MWMVKGDRVVLGHFTEIDICKIQGNDFRPLILILLAFAAILITSIVLSRPTPLATTRIKVGIGCTIIAASIAMKVGALWWMFGDVFAYRIYNPHTCQFFAESSYV